MTTVRSVSGEIFSVSLLFFLAGIFFSGCNDAPAPVGSGFVQDTIELKAISSDTVQLFRSTKVEANISTIAKVAPIYTLIGAVEEPNGQIRSQFTMRPTNVPDTLGNIAETDIIETALLLNPVKFRTGDTNSLFGFSVHEVLDTAVPGQTTMPRFSLASAGNFTPRQLNLRLSDSTKPETLRVDINKKIVANWFYQRARYSAKLKEIDARNYPDNVNKDSARAADKLREKDSVFGIAVIPDPSTKILHQFITEFRSGTGPRIFVRYKNKISGNTDTLTLTGGAADVMYISFPSANFAQNDIVIRAMGSARTAFDFDLTKIPRNVGVHAAELVLTLNREKSSFANGTGNILLMDSLLSFALPSASTSGELIEQSVGRFIYNDSLKLYQYVFPTLARVTDLWIHNSGRGTLYLQQRQAYERDYSVNKLVFYGLNEADSTKRPRLRILYSTRPNFK